MSTNKEISSFSDLICSVEQKEGIHMARVYKYISMEKAETLSSQQLICRQSPLSPRQRKKTRRENTNKQKYTEKEKSQSRHVKVGII